MPAKVEKLLEIVDALRGGNEKVVIWSNFVETLKLIKRMMEGAGHGPELASVFQSKGYLSAEGSVMSVR